MTLEEALLADIREHPEEDGPRLVYADWLEEQAAPGDGRAERAELIRAQMELARAWPDYPGQWLRPCPLPCTPVTPPAAQLRPLVERVRALAPRAAPPHRAGLTGCVLRRGFVEDVELTGGNLARAGPAFANPVRQLKVTQARGFGARIAALVTWHHLAGLELGEVPTLDLHALAGRAPLHSIRRLVLHRQRTADVLALAASALPPLTALRLGFDLPWYAAPPGVLLAVNACEPPTAAHAGFLAGSPILATLSELALSGWVLTAQHAEALARSPHLGNLTILNLCAGGLDAGGAAALLAAPWLPRLRTLRLQGSEWRNYLPSANLWFLPALRRPAALRELHLCSNGIGDTGARALASCPALEALEVLDLTGNRVSDAGAFALAESPYLGNLRRLDLFWNRIRSAGSAALQRRFGARAQVGSQAR
jgi:uncharacterized protein (TIGR02996 family)